MNTNGREFSRVEFRFRELYYLGCGPFSDRNSASVTTGLDVPFIRPPHWRQSCGKWGVGTKAAKSAKAK